MVERLKDEHNVDVDWRPFYLYFDTPPEGKDLPDHVKRARANGSEERLLQIADSYGMKFVSTKRIYNTRRAHEATEYAREHGNPAHLIPPFNDTSGARVINSIKWSFARFMPRESPANGICCGAVAEEVGLDADEMRARLKVRNIWPMSRIKSAGPIRSA